MKSTLLLCLLAMTSLQLKGQYFEGTGGPINDDNTLADYIIDVAGLEPAELTPDHGLVRVCINLTHTWVSDLDIRLIAPDGTNIMLTATKGDDQDNYENTCFDMSATEHIVTANAPFTGSFRPYSSLGNANNGQVGNGQWILRIWDQFAFVDTGELLSWSLEFGENATAPMVFDGSSLPIIVLNTNNVTIPNDPKIPGTIEVFDNGVFNRLTDVPSHSGYMGIETRGSSSQGFPKKSFGFETRDEFGDDEAIELLGLPEEEDWILYAPYTDKSLLRDALTYELGRRTGHYAPRTVFVELILNGDYHGIYCLEEKIKRDKNRVNITKLDPEDVIGDEITGGYMLKIDRDDGPGTYFVSNYKGTDINQEIRVVLEDPEGEDLVPEQLNYIQGYFNAFEDALYGSDFADDALGYRRYINLESFVDFFLVNELGHNVDGYRLSSFFYKDRNSKDSTFHMGPLWDFNLAYGNVNYCASERTEGWAFEDSGSCGNTPLWWERMLQDTVFVNAIRCRMNELRENVLHPDTILQYLDEQASSFENAYQRNYERWPILGVYIWPNWFIGSTYTEEVDFMKTWVQQRLVWLDENLPGNCLEVGTHDLISDQFSVFPNPVDDYVIFSAKKDFLQNATYTISNSIGQVVIKGDLSRNQKINTGHLMPGIYCVEIKLPGGRSGVVRFVRG